MALSFSLLIMEAERSPTGTVFTLISNTATTAISGTFANLSEGLIFSIGPNTYRVSYHGGDGNDLTLTVQ